MIALLINAVARSVHGLPAPVLHAPCVNHGASHAEMPPVLNAYPVTFGSHDCSIVIDSREDVLHRALFNRDMSE